MDWKIELIPVPVSDIERAKRFYSEQCGFVVDLDHHPNDSTRPAHLTPPASGWPVTGGQSGIRRAPGGLAGGRIGGAAIGAARAELVERGVDCTPVRHFDGGGWAEGKGGDWN